MAISRMQEPRQLYGLGSLVKKAVRGVKKIVKSPLGKAALLGLGAYGLGGAKFLGGEGVFRGGQGLSRFANLRNLFGSTSIMKNPVTDTVEKTFIPNKFGSFLKSMVPGTAGFKGKNLAIGLGGLAVATPFIQSALKMGPYEEVAEEVDESYIDPYTAYMMSRYREPGLAFLPNEQYVQSGYYLPQNAAEGGRIGYANGNMVEGEMQLPPEAEEYLRQEYVKYKQQGGDLSYPEFKKWFFKRQPRNKDQSKKK